MRLHLTRHLDAMQAAMIAAAANDRAWPLLGDECPCTDHAAPSHRPDERDDTERKPA